MGVRCGELEGILGLEALKELYEGLFDRLIGGAFSLVDARPGDGRELVRVMVGT